MDRMSPDERLDLLMAKFQTLTQNEKKTFVEGHYEHLMRYSDEVMLHKGMVDGFGRLGEHSEPSAARPLMDGCRQR